jgi:hypothetical protein
MTRDRGLGVTLIFRPTRAPFGCCPNTQRRVWAGYYPTPIIKTQSEMDSWEAVLSRLRGHPIDGALVIFRDPARSYVRSESYT